MPNLLIFEVDHNGHRFHYASLLAKEGLARGYEVTLATTRVAVQSDEFYCFFRDLAHSIKVDNWIEEKITGGLRGFCNLLAMLKTSIQLAKPDLVFIPYADGLAQLMSVAKQLRSAKLPDVPMRGLLFRCTAAYCDETTSAWSKWKHTHSALAAVAYPWDKLFHLDEFAIKWYSNRGKDLELMPDPLAPSAKIGQSDAKSVFGIQESRRVVGLVGHLEERKGVDLLLNAFIEADLPNAVLLLVGKTNSFSEACLNTPEVQRFVEAGRIILRKGWVSEESLNNAIRAMDIVCTPYPRHIGAASVVLRAAASHRPVLASDFGWVGKTVEKYNIGKAIPVSDNSVFSRSLKEFIEIRNTSTQYEDGFKELTSFHTPKHFCDQWFN